MKADFKARFAKFIAINILITGLLFMPFIYDVIFSMDKLIDEEIFPLWVFSVFLIITAVFIFLLKKKINPNILVIIFGLLGVIYIELFARVYVNMFRPEITQKHLAVQANITFERFFRYRGHPFLQYVGNPAYESFYSDDKVYGKYPYNKIGYCGSDYSYKKPDSIVRIVCLGGSTTEYGYPRLLEDYLNQNKTSDSIQYQVINLGLCGYNSNHSMVNFVLNVIDYNPDYVVFHHAWNDAIARNTENEDFLPDYSHALKHFNVPPIRDKYLIRYSIIYRQLKMRYMNGRLPEWANISFAAFNVNRKQTNEMYSDTTELKSFRRNIKNIIELSKVYGIVPVLATMPHSKDEKWMTTGQATHHIDQANAIIRDSHKNYYNNSILVDLDSIMSGKMDTCFWDIAHCTLQGDLLKGKLIGKGILGNR